MIRVVEQGAAALLSRLERGLNDIFTPRFNPLYQLGALAFLNFWVTAATGVYLYVFFDTSLSGAYASVEYLTEQQWWFGGVMRSLHRYASALLAVTATLHLLREFALGRFRGPRAFSWISGVPLLWLLFASAIGGYLLVWDQLAQYVAIATAEWLDWLPMFGDPLARNFLKPGSLSDRLFSLLVFLHIAIPLFLLVGMLIHVKRLKLVRANPPRGLTILSLVVLVSVSLLHPATSMAPADLAQSPIRIDLDWIYLNAFPLLDSAGPGGLWALLGSVTGLLVLLPRLSPQMPAGVDPVTSDQAIANPAVVDPDNCNGCTWCFQDCPFEAITMTEHQDKPGLRQAVVNADLCTACGICAGACPSATPFRHVDELVSGIEIPEFPLDALRRRTRDALTDLPNHGGVLVFGCDHGADVRTLRTPGVASVSLPCTGMLPPSFVDWTARQPGVERVLITGCHPEGCFQRHGSRWIEERLTGARQPHLRTEGGRAKVAIHWAGQREETALMAALTAGEAPARDTGSTRASRVA